MAFIAPIFQSKSTQNFFISDYNLPLIIINLAILPSFESLSSFSTSYVTQLKATFCYYFPYSILIRLVIVVTFFISSRIYAINTAIYLSHYCFHAWYCSQIKTNFIYYSFEQINTLSFACIFSSFQLYFFAFSIKS